MNNLLSELKRRNVFKVAIAYLMLSWLILQLVDVIADILESPPWFAQAILVLLLILFPIILIITWAFELTPDGLKKSADVEEEQSIRHSTGQKINYIIIAFLILVIGFQYWSGGDAPLPEEIVMEEPALTEDAIPVNSIAVLPFINMSSDPEQEYFSDGISEEILNVLAQIKDLKVTSRSSAFLFKGEGQDIPAVARQLGVSKILEGSVRKSGNRIRITAQLIEAATDTHLWSETYDRELSDIFAVQDEISKAIVDALKTTLNIDAANVNFAQGTTNIEAHEEYLLGLFYWSGRQVGFLEQAKIHYENATRLDPDYAEAWARLSVVYGFLSELRGVAGTEPYDETLEKVEFAVNKAVSLNPDLSEVQRALGFYYYYQYDFARALEYYKRATELNQNNADAFRGIALNLSRLNQFVESHKYREIAARVDPMSYLANSNLVVSYSRYEQFEKAEEIIARMMPLFNNTGGNKMRLKLDQGQYSEAIYAYHDYLREGFSAGMGLKRGISRILATVGYYDEIGNILEGTVEEVWSHYLSQNYTEFVELARDNYAPDVKNRTHLNLRALAELIDENYLLADGIYESYNACSEPIIYESCKYLYHTKRMLGDEKTAEEYLEKVHKLEKRANNEKWRLNVRYPNKIGEANTLVMAGEVDTALTLYKEQLANGFFHYEIMAPHFKELHDHPDWPAFLEDIKAWQADQQAKLAELSR